jgi:hypothetical protein
MHLEHLLSKKDFQIREFTQKEKIPRLKELEEDYNLLEDVHQKLVDLGVVRGHQRRHHPWSND